MNRLPSSVLLLTAGLIGGSCAPGAFEAPMSPSPRCGIHAARDFRASEEERERPPACALPDPEDIARRCSIHDWVTSPDYKPETYDDDGVPVGKVQPIPDYVVSDVECSFSGAKRNRAVCRFKLKTPAMPAGSVSTIATFEHRFVQDHGPTHHVYSTEWWPTKSCLPR